MGSDAEHKNEVDPSAIARADVYVADSLKQTRRLGELQHAVTAGTVPSDKVFPQLGEIIAGLKQGRANDTQITICDLTGTGIQDTAIATLAPREIEYMQAAGKIVAAMHQRVAEVMRPGVKQSDVVAEIYHTATRGVDGYWGDYPAAVPMIGAGADASAPHLTWSDRPLRSNESIFFELAGVHKRYHCPLSRTFFLGKPDQKFLDAEKDP